MDVKFKTGDIDNLPSQKEAGSLLFTKQGDIFYDYDDSTRKIVKGTSEVVLEMESSLPMDTWAGTSFHDYKRSNYYLLITCSINGELFSTIIEPIWNNIGDTYTFSIKGAVVDSLEGQIMWESRLAGLQLWADGSPAFGWLTTNQLGNAEIELVSITAIYK